MPGATLRYLRLAAPLALALGLLPRAGWAQPMPPDTESPFVGQQAPAPGAVDVAADATVAFCVYDAASGVAVGDVTVEVDPGTGPTTYSSVVTPGNFAATAEDPACTGGVNGAGGTFGTRVVVTPVASFSFDATVSVLPIFADAEGNAYAGGSWSFTVVSAPDAAAPTVGDEAPAPASTGASVGGPVTFCAYDVGQGVDPATLSVVVDDGTPTPYSGSQNAANFSAASDPSCASGVNGAASQGILVSITPVIPFPNDVDVTVTPTFDDLAGNAYAGGGWTFHTETEPPPPPDVTPPTVGTQDPAPGATDVVVGSLVRFCAYDTPSGVDVASLSVTVDDGTATTYSTSQNVAGFATSVNDPACVDGVDGANPQGVLVTVTPLSALPYSTAVTVTPAFQDQQARLYGDGGWTFTTEAAPDGLAPTLAGQSPPDGATDVATSTLIVFCAYDQGQGVDTASVSVVVDDGAPVTYSSVSNAANLAFSPDDPACGAGPDGANPRGLKVTVTPVAGLATGAPVTVSPGFSDLAANPYTGGGWSFTTTSGPPPPPDGTPPWVGDEAPAPSTTDVATTTTVAFCAYDAASGVDLATVAVTVDDGTTSTTYSSTQNAANIAFSTNDPACTGGSDGANANGVRVTVTPLSDLPNATTITVTPALADGWGNAATGTAWTFTTEAAADLWAPTLGGQSPPDGASDVATSATVSFCAYDQGAGVDTATISVVVDDGAPVTYSSVSNPAAITFSPDDVLCGAGADGANPRGLRVTIVPVASLATGTSVAVSPSFSDGQGNPYAGGGWSFTTTSGPPPPPDGTPPTLAGQVPGVGAVDVSESTAISFCAYDAASGVDPASVAVSVFDGTSTTVYSSVQNAANFALSTNDVGCTGGSDGANPRGLRVTVTPLSALPYATGITVTPSLADAWGNAATGTAWSFTTADAPDYDLPTRGNESPAAGATGVALSSPVSFCAYDLGSGIDVASIQVTLDDGSPTVYSTTQNAGAFSASVNDAACTGGGDGANPRGVRVTVTPGAGFAQSTTVAVTTAFADVQGNAFSGSGWSFTTTGGPPPPPDGTPPYRGTETPPPGDAWASVTGPVSFCAYDDASGVSLGSIAVVIDDGATVRTYSATQNAANFSTSVDDPACVGGRDGGNPRGVRVSITPVTDFPYTQLVQVTPAFQDQRGNAYANGAYTFTTRDAPDYDAPTVGTQSPGDGATDVPSSAPIRFCAYDVGSGVEPTSLTVDVDDGGGALTYSTALTPGNFATTPNAPACSGGVDGADPNGLLVTVTPFVDLPLGAVVSVLPAFTDRQGNAFAGAAWSFTVTNGPPPPPDGTPPFRATEVPAPGATWIPVNTTVAFCAYDAASGVDLASLSVTLDHGAGPVTYSPSINPGNFSTTVNDPGCSAGRNGSDPFGVKVEVSPLAAFPNDTLVTVTTAMADGWGNLASDAAYSFRTELAADTTAPVRATETPAPNADQVPLGTTIVFCAYDEGWGVDAASVQVTVDDGDGPVVYSTASNPTNFSVTPSDPTCSDGIDGGNPYGTRVEVTPVAQLPADRDVLVSPDFQDLAGNPYAGGAYQFRTLIIIDPAVRITDPVGNTVLGGDARLRIAAYYPDGLSATTPVQVSFNNLWDAANRITLTAETPTLGSPADPARGVYDLIWNTAVGVLADDGASLIGAVGSDVDQGVTVYARAVGVDARTGLTLRTYTVANVGGKPMGGGTLLRREAGDSLCRSCHDVKGHAAADLDTSHGNWSFGCWDCHTAHGGTNLMLVRSQIETPNSGTRSVDLRDLDSGVADYGLAELDDGAGGTNGLPAGTGVCEVCHTRTKDPDGTPRFRNTGEGGGSHYTSNCTSCHSHSAGFAGGGACDGCHNAPPTTPSIGNVHLVHDGSGVVPDTYGSPDSASATSYYRFGCGKCHPDQGGQHMNSSGSGTSGDPRVVQVDGWFDSATLPPADVSSSVDPSYTPGSNVYAEQGPNGQYYQYSDGTCSNVYCHGEFPGGNTANDPVFTTGTQACGDCHGASAGSPPGGGSHAVHVATLGLDCAACHEGVVDTLPAVTDKSLHVNGTTDWNLDRTHPGLGAVATYSGSETGAQTPDGAYGQCGSTYCHSNGAPITGGNVFQAPTWGGSLSGGCTACHGGDSTSGSLIGDAASPLRGSTVHGVHVGDYGFACDDCHGDTVASRASNTTLAAANTTHLDGAKSLAFGAWPVDQTGGTFNQSAHSCSNLYCHSDGQRASAPFNPPQVVADWDGGASGCTTCHAGAGPNNTALSAAHFRHTETDGYAFACDTCHGQTVSGGAIADRSLHVNGTPDFHLTGAPNQADGSGSLGGSCSGIYCHSDGSDFSAPFSGARTVNWGDTASCSTCHGDAGSGGAPSYSSGSPKANSHDAHAPYACSTCHSNVVDSGKNILSKTLHVNGSYQVQAAGGEFTASAGSPGSPTTCNSVTCHGGGSATWGATLGCASCHTGAGDVDSYVYNDATTARIDDAEWTSYGHGASGSTPSGNPGAGFDARSGRGCAYCHDAGVAHDTAGNFFRLANTGLGLNGTCRVCHDSGFSGYDGGGTLPGSDGVDVGSNHYGSHHGGASGENGGERCWDCHDPHGDQSQGGNPLWYMVRSRPWEHVDANGFPTILAAAVEFNATLNGFDADSVLDADDYVDASVGFCNNCHDNADGISYYFKGASGTHNIDPTTPGNRCTDCHTHDNGFQGAGSCNACHDAPPPTPSIGNLHLAHDGIGADTYGTTANASTPAAYGFPCGKCHQGSHLNDSNNPYVVEVVFDSSAEPQVQIPGQGAPSFTRGTVYSETGPGGESFSYTDGTCSNVYCHGEFPGGNTANDATFQTGTQACGACHGASAGSPPAGGSHARHVGTYGQSCDLCHESVVNASGSVIDKSRHVDGAATWDLKRTDPGMGGSATYSGSETGSKNPPSASYGQCSSTYCHSDGRGGAPQTVPTWGANLGCGACHGQAGATTTPLAGAHFKHTETDGYAFACQTCHGQTVTGSSTIATPSLHTNGSVDTWLSGAPNQSNGTGTLGSSCSALYCHSAGNDFTSPYSGAKTVNWTDIGSCWQCHGTSGTSGAPSYATGSPKANSHSAHSPYACNTCHANVVDGGGAVTDTSLHVNGSYQLQASSGQFSASAGSPGSPSTCSSITCHGGGSATWGQTLACIDCHGSANDLDDWNISNGVAAQISTSEWTSVGHGGPLGGANPCLYCHDDQVAHGDSGNPFRLANVGGAAGPNGNCNVCHGPGSTGYSGQDSNVEVATEHQLAGHDNTHDGGARCWDCHDPHGDDANVKMIGDILVRDANDTYGLSATRTTTPVVFTRSGVTGADYARMSSPYNGVCNVCHTQASTNYYRSDYGENHNQDTFCTDCHSHDDNFQGAGSCLGCHASGKGSRRAVVADFGLQSHHVGNGGTMGGTLTDFDCTVCHAEGDAAAGTTAVHMNGVIDLRSADAPNTTFAYDVDAVRSSAGAAANWGSGNATWESQTSTRLDPFCLTCHDSNGAQVIGSGFGDAGASPTNPFSDAIIGNNYDQVDRGGVVDIDSMVTGNPPPQGQFSRHAVRGRSTSRYSSQQIPNSYWNQSQYAWNDTSVMGCADCHTSDGANGSAGNAHGSNSEYLLKDNAGGANEGTLGGNSYVCYRCHALGSYQAGVGHTGNGSDYTDYVIEVGTARIPEGNTGGNIYATACTNCHGGFGFGTIHGTSQTIPIGQDGGSGTRDAYRFMNGASLRYYDPGDWQGSGATCYTLGAKDSFGGCTKHGRGTGFTPPVSRPLNY